MIKAFKDIMMQVPTEHQTELQKIYELGTTIYTPEGLDLFLSTKHQAFNAKQNYK